MEIKFRRYQSDDFDRMHSFFINSNHKLGYIRNWTFDRMNFSPCFGQIMHDYTEHWPDEIGIWEYDNGEIAAIVCSEGEENGIVFINIDGFDKFADFFFDGLIADWFVQSKIHKSQESVSRVKSEVYGVLNKLSRMRDSDKNEIARLESDLSRIVTEA